jgi:hypothetical protein
MRDAVPVAVRLLIQSKVRSPTDTTVPFIIIDQFIRSDGVVDKDEPNTIRIAYRQAENVGHALYRSHTSSSHLDHGMIYKLHTFQLALILAKTMYECGLVGVGDDSQERGWEWEKELFGGWIAGTRAPIVSDIPVEEQWTGRIGFIALLAPKDGIKGYYRIDESKITRHVEGGPEWEKALHLIDDDATWVKGKLCLLKQAGPPEPTHSTRVRQFRKADGSIESRLMSWRIIPADEEQD